MRKRRSSNGHHHAHPHLNKHGKRRGRKRRAAAHGLLMGAMMFSAQAKPKAILRNGPKSPLPTAEVVVSIDRLAILPPSMAYDDIIDEAARTHELDANLIHAVIEAESHFNPLARSPVGAEGLMQLMPILQEELGVEDPFDPRENIMAGAQYLKRLLDRHNGDVELALASYNAGPANVSKYRGVPPFKETRNYVKKVRALLDAPEEDLHVVAAE